MTENANKPNELSFDGNVYKNWTSFRQRFQIYLEATDKISKSDKTKIAILLNLAGDKAIDIYNQFNFEVGENKDTLEVVLSKFERYCSPRKNIVYERFVFFNTVQKEGQPFDDFLTELKANAKLCEFKEEEELVRDRIVFGVRDKTLQQRLLRENNLTQDVAARICRTFEASKHHQLMMEGATAREVVDTASEIRKKTNIVPYDCFKCGKKHLRGQCPAYGKVCVLCKNKNHFALGCKLRKQNKYDNKTVSLENSKNSFRNSRMYSYKDKSKKKVNTVELSQNNSDDSEDSFFIDTLFVESESISIINKRKADGCWYELVAIKNTQFSMKIDTGATCNILPKYCVEKLKLLTEIENTNSELIAFGGNKIQILGVISLPICLRSGRAIVKFLVADVNDKPILGLKTCIDLGLVNRVNSVNNIQTKEDFVERYREDFAGLGKMPKKYTIVLKSESVPVVKPVRRVPEIIKGRLEKSLKKLVEKGIIEPVDYPTDWVNQITIVEKANGKLRICLDPTELNKCIKLDNYPIPTLTDIEQKLSGKKLFTVLDMKDGFFQIQLSEESSLLTTFITPFGKFKFNRLPFGLNVSPEVFQRTNTRIFGDINVGIYFDDLIIGGSSEEEHDGLLQTVMTRARQSNIKFNKSKLQYKVTRVKYLGRIFTEKGMEADPDQIRAIKALESPKNKNDLKKILGMISYLCRFIPNMSEVTSPLRELVKQDIEFNWSDYHENVFRKLKELVMKAPVLRIFDNELPIDVFVDASMSGLGSCLMQNGSPVMFASRSLTETEKRYSQIEKEYLGICFATQKFHEYIYGRTVNIYTDHKPLIAISKKNLQNIPTRLQRMKLKLIKYDLNVKYVPGKKNIVADVLSRNYIREEVLEDKTYAEVVHCATELSMSKNRIREYTEETKKDQVLQKLKHYFYNKWPSNRRALDNDVKTYWQLRDAITVRDGLVFINDRILVPTSLRKEMLRVLHESHFGIEKTKRKARTMLYWPKMSSEIERMINKCRICQRFANNKPKEKLLPHEIPDYPFEKVAVDIFEYGSNTYLAMMDYYTKWIEVREMRRKTSEEVIRHLKSIFSTHGIPRVLIADNMPFSSSECKQFSDSWNFDIITSSPLYPKSNGLAEKAVGIAKKILKKSQASNTDFDLVMLNYRNHPTKGLDHSPAELLFSRQLRTKVPIVTERLKPKLAEGVKEMLERNQNTRKHYYDRGARVPLELKKGEDILIRDRDEKIWRPGLVISKHNTPRSYNVMDEEGRNYRRNSAYLRKSLNKTIIKHEPDDSPNDLPANLHNVPVNQDTEVSPPAASRLVTRSGRQCKAPSYLKDYIVGEV